MAEKTENTITPEAEAVMSSAKGFWNTYSKPITYIGSAVILLIAGWYAYQQFLVKPKETKAAESIIQAEKLFDQMAGAGFNADSVNIVLNGGNLEGVPVTGLLKVISQYGGTQAGNRARYLAGASYLHIGQYAKAVTYLKEFDAHGATQVDSRKHILLGHAYAEQKKNAEALSAYESAAAVNSKDEAMTTDALMIAASFAKATGQTQKAIDLFSKLKDQYPASSVVTNGEVDKQLASLGKLN